MAYNNRPPDIPQWAWDKAWDDSDGVKTDFMEAVERAARRMMSQYSRDNIDAPSWAKELADRVIAHYVDTDTTVDDAVFIAIFEARSSAYEECAKIAEEEFTADSVNKNTRGKAYVSGEVAIYSGKRIAQAIRSQANQ